MEIEIEVTETIITKKMINIKLPVFVDVETSRMCQPTLIKILNESLFVMVYHSADNTCAAISTYDSQATDYITNGKPVTEDEFNKYYSEALSIIQNNSNS